MIMIKNIKVGENTIIDPSAEVSVECIIGNNVIIKGNVTLMDGIIVGDNNTLNGENNVIIGNNVKIQNNSLIYEGVTIEDSVFIGPNVVTTNDIYPDVSNDWKHRFRTTLFKKGCSISANSTIICGNVIGENTLIGAGSVVSKSMPPNSICFGNPCKFKSVKKI
jgi:acetyltransferase-like isoleucine patch superfamily enzyme